MCITATDGPVAWCHTGVSVSLSATRVRCVKKAVRLEVLFEVETWRHKEHSTRWGGVPISLYGRGVRCSLCVLPTYLLQCYFVIISTGFMAFRKAALTVA